MFTKIKIFLFIFIIPIISMAQVTEFKKNITKADKLMEEGRPKDAYKILKDQFEKSKAANNPVELLYLIPKTNELESNFDEYGDEENINRLKKYEVLFKPPYNALYQLLLAQKYACVYQEEKYEIDERTINTADKVLALDEWDKSRFLKTIYELYQKAKLQQPALEKISAKEIDILLIQDKNSAEINTNAYSLSSSLWLETFSIFDESTDAAAFEFNKADYFSDAATFVKLSLQHSDPIDAKFNIIKIFQERTEYFLRLKDTAGLLDNELNRLHYVQDKATIADKENLTEKAWLSLAESYPNHPDGLHAKTKYIIAHLQKTSEIKDVREKQKTAQPWLVMLRAIAENKKALLAANLASNHLVQWDQKSLDIQTENYIVPNQPYLMRVNSQNIKTIAVKIYAADASVDFDEVEINKIKVASKATFSKVYDLAKDITCPYSTELIMDALPSGLYILDISSDDVHTKQRLKVTDIAIAPIFDKKEKTGKLQIISRSTGLPKAGVEVSVFESDYTNKGNKSKLLLSKVSDKNGVVNITNVPGLITIDITEGQNTMTFLVENYFYYGEEKILPQQVAELYTDRAIYRPGQTVNFKAICYTKQGNAAPNLIVNKKVKFSLFDSNGESIAELESTTNEFGSCIGSFNLPISTNTGSFSIRSSELDGYKSFKVEEYKRPKFEIKPDTIKANYALNDKVITGGTVISYSGIPLENATIKYRITRNTRFKYWWCWLPDYDNQEFEVSNGITQTDKNGKYVIDFKAIADADIKKENFPEYIFTIEVDAIDNTGETHAASTEITFSYYDVNIAINSEEQKDINDKSILNIKTTNSSNQFTAKEVTLTISELIVPAANLKPKLWEDVDIQLYSEAEWKKQVPNESYIKTDNKLKWPIAKEVSKSKFTTKENGEVDAKINFAAGKYFLVEAQTFTAKGESVVDKKVIYIDDKSKTILNPTEALSVKVGEVVFGQPMKITVHQPFDQVLLMESIFSNQQEIADQKIISKTYEKSVVVDKNDAPSVHLRYAYFKNNRLYEKDFIQSIVLPKKKYKIDLITFRDKLEPGAKEEWKLKISGEDKEQIVAELMASMYDESLETFAEHKWSAPNFAYFVSRQNRYSLSLFNTSVYNAFAMGVRGEWKIYDQVQRRFSFGSCLNNNKFRLSTGRSRNKMFMADGVVMGVAGSNQLLKMVEAGNVSYAAHMESGAVDSASTTIGGTNGFDYAIADVNSENKPLVSSQKTPPPLRTNLSELALWMPQMHTDKDGNIILKFTMPEALTRWKLLLLAHTQNLDFAQKEASVVTQKELMLTTNNPRFLRQQDKIAYTAKVSNLSSKAIDGVVNLELVNALTDKPLDFTSQDLSQNFSLTSQESKSFSWDISIPKNYLDPIYVRVRAEGGGFSDGEQNLIPALTNMKLVTETRPYTVRAGSKKTIVFDAIKEMHGTPVNLTIENSSNPAFNAVLALPYLANYEHDCAEQTFHKYYAYALAAKIGLENPKLIQYAAEILKDSSKEGLSRLMKNPELKNILLHQTPWLSEATDENAQIRKVAELLDANNNNKESLDKYMQRLLELKDTYGFTWFKGMQPSRYITQEIVTGIARLQKLDAIPEQHKEDFAKIVKESMAFLDKELKDEYRAIMKQKAKPTTLSPMTIQYLYMRTMLAKIPADAATIKAQNYFIQLAQKSWLQHNTGQQAMIALFLQRKNDKSTPAKILNSLEQNAIKTYLPITGETKPGRDLGMYWKQNNSPYWHESGIGNQALLIEAFSELQNNDILVDEMKIWLLQQKQTQRWSNTIATADACYALLLRGTNFANEMPTATITTNNKVIDIKATAANPLGYSKIHYANKSIQPELAALTIDNRKATSGTLWGSMYYQYFEELNNIKSDATPLKITKKIYVVVNTNKGETLQEITSTQPIKVGDRVHVRLTISTDRNMEYVHLEDMRGAAFEPVEQLSTYEYKGGLGFYRSARDVANHFFIQSLSVGTFSFEYDLFATQSGTFSNGIATLQCMYAPEFSAHSEGLQVQITK